MEKGKRRACRTAEADKERKETINQTAEVAEQRRQQRERCVHRISFLKPAMALTLGASRANMSARGALAYVADGPCRSTSEGSAPGPTGVAGGRVREQTVLTTWACVVCVMCVVCVVCAVRGACAVCRVPCVWSVCVVRVCAMRGCVGP